METKRAERFKKARVINSINPAENSNKPGMEKHPLPLVIRRLSKPSARAVSGVRQSRTPTAGPEGER